MSKWFCVCEDVWTVFAAFLVRFLFLGGDLGVILLSSPPPSSFDASAFRFTPALGLTYVLVDDSGGFRFVVWGALVVFFFFMLRGFGPLGPFRFLGFSSAVDGPTKAKSGAVACSF